MASKELRYRFWCFVHDKIEALWHWIYYHKVKPLAPDIGSFFRTHYTYCGSQEPTEKQREAGIEEVRIYRSAPGTPNVEGK